MAVTLYLEMKDNAMKTLKDLRNLLLPLADKVVYNPEDILNELTCNIEEYLSVLWKAIDTIDDYKPVIGRECGSNTEGRKGNYK